MSEPAPFGGVAAAGRGPLLGPRNLVLLLAGLCGGVLAGIPVPEATIQAGSLGLLISLGVILGERAMVKGGLKGRGVWIRTRWLILMGTVWGAVIGKLTATGTLAFSYGAHSQTFGFHYPMTNTFGQTIEGIFPGIITGICVAVAMGLVVSMIQPTEKLWFAVFIAIPLGWWTGAESLAVGQALGHLDWDYIGPAQIQGMRFGIPWMECMLIFHHIYLRSTGELQRLRAAEKAADDAKWAAAEPGFRR